MGFGGKLFHLGTVGVLEIPILSNVNMLRFEIMTEFKMLLFPKTEITCSKILKY